MAAVASRFRTMKTSELSGPLLDYWVARAKGIETFRSERGELCYVAAPGVPPRAWAPSRFWSQAGPIIEEAKVELNWEWEGNDEWTASVAPQTNCQGGSALEAAMRAFVESRLGPNVNEAG